MSNALRLGGALLLAIVLIAVVPLVLNATGRFDLYYTLTLISLLSIASAGVWITFYLGRINIGQAAYALIGGYVSAVLVTAYGRDEVRTEAEQAGAAPTPSQAQLLSDCDLMSAEVDPLPKKPAAHV